MAIGLNKVVLRLDDLEDATMDRILNWLLTISSKTLQELHLTSNALTHFPEKIAYFKNLEYVYLSSQTDYRSGISSLANGSYVSSGSLRTLDLRECGIKSIEAGAFSGNMD